GGMTLEQRQRQLAQQGKVLGTVASLDATIIFPKRHIQLPVQTVLNPPMMPQPLPIVAGARHLAANKITEFVAGFTADRSLRITHADRRQSCPRLGVAKALRVMQDRITAILLPAVATLPCLIG